jgi:rhamnulokinase
MSAPLQAHLGIDVGAESGRVMAGLWDGRRMELAEEARFPNRSVELDGVLRWDPAGLWSGVRDGLARAGRSHGGRAVSVGADTWGLDYVLLSRSGELVGLPRCYRDASHPVAFDEVLRRIPRQELFARTGIQFMPINTLYQWVAHHARSPEAFAAADRFLMMPDWLHHLLCGSDRVEFTNATTTQFHDPLERTWCADVLGRLGLPTHLLPKVAAPGTRLGRLLPRVAEATGLAGVEVVAPPTHDTASAVVGIPTGATGRPGWAYISSGTWSLVGFESPVPHLGPEALALNVTNEGGVEGTWRVLKNVMGLWLLQRCRSDLAAGGTPTDYATLAARAAAAPPLRSLVDPDHPSFLNPPDMPAAIAAFCRRTGQPVPGDEAGLARCVLDSLALKYARVLRGLESLAGHRFEVVHLVGGGSRNGLLNQSTADALGCPVVAGPAEATALGNVLWQARGCGELGSLAEVRQAAIASVSVTRFEPSADRSAWLEAAGRMQDLMEVRA